LEALQEAAVHPHPDAFGTLQLVGYIVPRAGTATPAGEWRDELRAHLSGLLPDYMVPTLWVVLERLPRTPNGKLDRKALPAPDVSQLQAQHRPPEGELEAAVAAVWSEVLGVRRIGRDDNFFALGGHSLLAMQVSARLRQRVNLEVPLNTVFEAPGLQEFAARLGTLSRAADEVQLRELDAFLDTLEEA
jgi:hypothetical protein